MESAERLTLHEVADWTRVDLRDAAAWLLPFVAIAYLGLNNGGYDVIERSEVGIVIWWAVLTAVVVGQISISKNSVASRVLLFLLLGFSAWTALSLIWTESSERTVIEIGRVLSYTGFFALMLSLQGEGRWRYTLGGVTAGIVLICEIALLSKMEPTWFPEQATGRFIGGLGGRLLYPLNYSSGLGSLAAIGLPLLLAAASYSRTIVIQALAVAAMPLCALTLWLSASGLSVPVAVLAMLTFLALTPDRVPKLGSLLVAAAGSAILFAAVVQRAAFDDGLTNTVAQKQGHELLATSLVVCAGVGLLQAGISLAVRHGQRPRWLRVSREGARAAALVTAVTLILTIGVFGASGGLSSAWNHFKSGPSRTISQKSRATQILDYSSSGRYAFWRSAVRANEAHPWVGIGAGSFQFWWARDGDSGFVRNAHSLYLETLAELGIIGFLVIGSFSIAVVGLGCVRAWRPKCASQTALAAATAGCVGFVAAATIDWMWQLAVLPVIFFALAAIVCADDARGLGPAPAERSRLGGRAAQVAIAAICLVALAANVIPLATSEALQKSRSNASAGHLQLALEDAKDAARVQPYAATPHLQEALVLEELNQMDAAAVSIRQATRDEPANWAIWMIRARIAARQGNIGEAIHAYRRARSLNPRSTLFQR